MEHPLRTYRRANGLTIDAFAAKAETSRATLSRIENWKQEPSLALIRKLIKAADNALDANDFMPPTEAAA